MNGIEKLIDVWHTLDKIFIFSENINFRKIKLLGWIKLASRNLLFKTISLLWNSSTMTHFHDSVTWNINTARMKWPVVSTRGEFIFSAFLVRETKMWKQKQIFKKLWAVSSACESILLPRNKIDMLHIICISYAYHMQLDVSIKGTNKLLYWRFKWDSTCANDYPFIAYMLTFMITIINYNTKIITYNIHPARVQTYLFLSVEIITVTTIIAMIYHLLKGDSTYVNTNQPNWRLKWDSTDSY